MSYRATGAVALSPADAAYQNALVRYQVAVAARNAILNAVKQDQAAYNAQMASYTGAAASIQQRDQSNMAGFNAAYAAWQKRKSDYDAIVARRTQILNAQKAQSDAALAHVTPPPGYNGCLTQADHDAYVRKCAATPNITVKGVGLVGALGALFGLSGGDSPECLWSNLPVCAALPALPPEPGYPPVAPAATPLPTPPKKPAARKIPPEPVPPKKPAPVVIPSAPPPPVAPEQPKGFVAAGLLAAVIVVGGGVAYFHFKKKKAAA